MTIVIAKLLLTPAIVLVATLLSRRLGHAAGGWLVGLPLTSGPVAVFLAIEHGSSFAQHAADGSLEGGVGEAVFAATYMHLAARFGWPTCVLVGSLTFLAAGLLLMWLNLPTVLLVGIAVGSLLASLRALPPPRTPAPTADAPVWDLPLRMAVATLLVLLVTSVASIIGPDASGLAAAYPVLAMILAVFAHRQHGALAARGVMHGLLAGLFGFAGFFAAVAFLVTRIDAAATFGIALLVNLAIHAAAFRMLRNARMVGT